MPGGLWFFILVQTLFFSTSLRSFYQSWLLLLLMDVVRVSHAFLWIGSSSLFFSSFLARLVILFAGIHVWWIPTMFSFHQYMAVCHLQSIFASKTLTTSFETSSAYSFILFPSKSISSYIPQNSIESNMFAIQSQKSSSPMSVLFLTFRWLPSRKLYSCQFDLKDPIPHRYCHYLRALH